MKTLIMGATDNYKWAQIKPWALSIKEVEFQGDVVLFVYRGDDELLSEVKNLGFIVIPVNHDDFGQPINHNKDGLPSQCHRMRAFHGWQFLLEERHNYNTVIINDTRDVYYQTSIDAFMGRMDRKIIYYPLEGVKFKDESWNANMVKSMFGPYVYQTIEHDDVINSGTFFGNPYRMCDILFTIYFMAKTTPMTGSDQPILNMLYSHSDLGVVLPHDFGWMCQCGATIDPTKPELTSTVSYKPYIRKDGIVVTSDGRPFVGVHQWDRVEDLKHLIEEKYK